VIGRGGGRRMTDDDLPPLPELTRTCAWSGYTADDMRDYARAAIEKALECNRTAPLSANLTREVLFEAWQRERLRRLAREDEIAACAARIRAQRVEIKRLAAVYARADVAQERERCARVAEAYTDPHDGPDSAEDTRQVAASIAAVIRALNGGER
jgi:hypothetical protein